MSEVEKHSIYLHGTSEEEQRRLSLLNDLLNDAALKELGLKGGERILDIGSGLGQFSRGMARAAGRQVIGIERSAEQIQTAIRLAQDAGEQHLIDLRNGDAENPPIRPEEWGTFDLAHARFLLEHVPDPLKVVRSMVSAVRPGGRIVLEDDDHDIFRIWPDSPGFYRAWHAYMETYRKIGNDPTIGRRLIGLLNEAGAKPVRNTWLFFASCSGNPTFPLYIENMIGVVSGAEKAIVGNGLMSASELHAVLEAFRAWKARPDAALWYGVCWAEGIRRDKQLDEK